MRIVLVIVLFAFTSKADARGETIQQRSFSAWVHDEQGTISEDARSHSLSVSLRASWISDVDLEKLEPSLGIRQLDLSLTRVTDLGLERLGRLVTLAGLNLRFAEFITDQGIAHLRSCKRLERLDLKGTKITDTALEHLTSLPMLKWLDISFTQVTDGGFDSLLNVSKLEALIVGGNKLTSRSLPVLKLFPALKHLDLSGKQRTDSGLWGLELTDLNMDQIAAIHQLQSLNLAGTRISDLGASKLSALKGLHSLNLDGTQVSERSLRMVAALPKLQRLSLWHCQKVHDKDVELLQTMKSLAILDLTETSVTGQALQALKGMASLRLLYLGGTAVSPSDLKAFQQARPNCQVSFWEEKPVVKPEEPEED